MVYDELEMLQRMKHPHIVDWFESRDKYYIVTQLATGGELFDRICEQGRFTGKDASQTIRQVLEAVDYLHGTLLLTGLALSFRSTTAYERYSDGRKSWATLSVQSRNIARLVWVHIDERPGEVGKDDLLSKLTAMNLILAFAVSLKHKLRFEPYAHYADICSLVGHLDTFAQAAYTPEVEIVQKKTPWKAVGEYLGLSFASSNPRKAIKRACRPLGNLPLEILTYLSSYCEEMSVNGTLKSPIIYGQIMTALAALTDTQASAERVLTTPLPVGYNILISQIVLLYVYLLPFQLYSMLGWINTFRCEIYCCILKNDNNFSP